MKANDFLKLVGRLLTTQQNYFKNRLQGDLVQAKAIEKEVLAVIKIGKLEPDEPKPVYTNLDLFGGGANFCVWSHDPLSARWDTTCKQTFETGVNLEKHNFRFCPNCGKQIYSQLLVTGD